MMNKKNTRWFLLISIFLFSLLTCFFTLSIEAEENDKYILKENSVYIESAGINKEFKHGELTQADVDNNDVIYNTSKLGEDNPIILGHDYNGLKKLYEASVGSYIYINNNGEVETYKIIVSEKAIKIDGGRDLQGVETGTRLLASYDIKTLHIYTCYGRNRWLVIAQKM